MVKIYTKKRGDHPDLNDPICLRKGSTIEVRRPVRGDVNSTDSMRY